MLRAAKISYWVFAAAVCLLLGLMGPTAIVETPECWIDGGSMQRVGAMQGFACVRPFVDAGKTCTDDSQCQGKICVAAYHQDHMPTGAGTCRRDDNGFGCMNGLRQGKPWFGGCID